jgi:hypothetical protein
MSLISYQIMGSAEFNALATVVLLIAVALPWVFPATFGQPTPPGDD